MLRDLLEHPEDGRIKLFLIWQSLAARRAHEELFLRGDYHPVQCEGSRQEMAFGFARTLDSEVAVALVPRMFARAVGEEARYPLGPFWEDTRVRLPGAGPLLDVFTGQAFAAGEMASMRAVFRDLPFALLVSPSPEPRARV